MLVGEASANRAPIPCFAWVAGIVLSFVMSGLVVVAFSVFDAAPVTTYLVPPSLVVLAAFAFSATWPGRPLFWGVILTSGFWAYFLAVFIAYLSTSQWDGSSLARLLMTLLAGVGGGIAATRIRARRGSGQTAG